MKPSRLVHKIKSPSGRQRRTFLIVSAAGFFNNYDGALLNLALSQIQAGLKIGEAAIGPVVSMITLGTVLSPLITSQADRYGRRRLLLLALAGCSLLSGLSAFSWNAASFIGFKFFTTAFASVEGSIAIVILVEEVNADSRGLALGLLAAISASGYALAAIGFAGIAIFPFGWRGLFILSFIPLLLIVPLWRMMPESSRYEKSRDSMRQQGFLAPFNALFRTYPRRFAMIAGVMFLNAMGGTPGGLMQSKYLQQAHGWTPQEVAILMLGGGAVGVLGNIIAGHLSDHLGRRIVGPVFLIAAPLLGALFFNLSGAFVAAAWIGALFSQTAGSTVLNTFSAELFPTSHRSTAESVIAVAGTIGGSASLFIEGWLYTVTGSHWHAVTVLMSASILAGIGVAIFYPETAGSELEAISPERDIPKRRRA
ncbi:MAG: MFS transporter [Candidatus Binataceae bacterium]|nr:MFS transporter [Candidatus Binataceae bacterium]